MQSTCAEIPSKAMKRHADATISCSQNDFGIYLSQIAYRSKLAAGSPGIINITTNTCAKIKSLVNFKTRTCRLRKMPVYSGMVLWPSDAEEVS